MKSSTISLPKYSPKSYKSQYKRNQISHKSSPFGSLNKSYEATNLGRNKYQNSLKSISKRERINSNDLSMGEYKSISPMLSVDPNIIPHGHIPTSRDMNLALTKFKYHQQFLATIQCNKGNIKKDNLVRIRNTPLKNKIKRARIYSMSQVQDSVASVEPETEATVMKSDDSYLCDSSDKLPSIHYEQERSSIGFDSVPVTAVYFSKRSKNTPKSQLDTYSEAATKTVDYQEVAPSKLCEVKLTNFRFKNISHHNITSCEYLHLKKEYLPSKLKKLRRNREYS